MFTTWETDGSIVICSTGRSKKKKKQKQNTISNMWLMFLLIVWEACYKICKNCSYSWRTIYVYLVSTLIQLMQQKENNVFLKCTSYKIRLFWLGQNNLWLQQKERRYHGLFFLVCTLKKVLSQLSNFPTIYCFAKTLSCCISGRFCRAH